MRIATPGPGLVLATAVLTLAACGGSGAAELENGGSPTGDLDGRRPSGVVLAASGFDVATNGFSFENYGNEAHPLNLDSTSMVTLFGDQVCAGKVKKGGGCKLVPTAKKWMASMNDTMGGGHCFGLAGLSWALYKGQVSPQKYGAREAAAMSLDGNKALQADVAAIFATQSTEPTTSVMKTYAPTDAVRELAAAWQRGDGYALGLSNVRNGEQVGGHAVTPVALESLGDGKVGIVLYDNNYPKAPQTMVVDTVANTWTYSTASNPADDPEAYHGGVDNPLELWPVTPMLGPQNCPFCSEGSATTATGVDGKERTVKGGSALNYVYLNQESDAKGVKIAVTDLAGKPIAGATAVSPLSGGQQAPPAVLVPKSVAFKVTIDGSALSKPADTDLSVIGPGYSFAVDKFTLDPGVVDAVVYDPTRASLVYLTQVGSAPDVSLTLDGDLTRDSDEASYSFVFGGLELPESGGAIEVALDQAAQRVTASSHHSGPSQIDFVIDKVTADSDEQFTSEPIPLEANESLIVEYGSWGGAGTPMPVGIDTDGSGQITERLVGAD